MKENEKTKKLRPLVTIEQYLKLCEDKLSEEEYLNLEKVRVRSLFKINASDWISIIENQKNQCYYCQTDIRIIQQLIYNKIINPRKRGTDSYSGLHFELDHKNANKEDNRLENLVASCYYCNNDKSNTISSEIFKNYFGNIRSKSFSKLLEDKNILKPSHFIHNLNNKFKS